MGRQTNVPTNMEIRRKEKEACWKMRKRMKMKKEEELIVVKRDLTVSFAAWPW